MPPHEKDIKPGNENAKKNFFSFNEEGFSIAISDDMLTVAVDLFPPEKEGQSLISSLKIKQELESIGIKTPILEEILKTAVAKFNNDKIKVSALVVSKGVESQKGKDGWFELLCSKKLTENHKNRIDENFNEIISLRKDELVGVIHLPQNGKDGLDVFGKIIPAEHGKPKDINLGENLYTKEKIVISIYSSIDGFLHVKKNSLSVTELLTIHGDIDYKTGNILGYGSLKVIGNVINGFYLNLKQNVEIGGYVGDAEIIAGKNIKISGGFLGAGTGKITAGGNIEVKFIQDQKVYTRGSLNFVREIVHSKIYVKDNIIGKGNHASIIGGYTVAGKNVEIYSSGNEYGLTTVIEVGYDYEVKEQLINNRREINKHSRDLKKINLEIIEYSHMKRLNEEMYKKLQKLAEQHKHITEEIEKLAEINKQLIKTVREPSGSYVKIGSTVFPGTKIIINRRHLVVRERMNGKTFKLSEEKEIIAV